MKLFFSVGEPSGDLHGANLIRELRARHPEVEAVGFGGPRMAAAGCELHEDLTNLAVMGFLRVFFKLHHFFPLLRRADRYFQNHRPDAVVLIDYPGFNWWIARRAKRHGIPVIYYGTPQMWAWASWRVNKMRRLVDHVLCKLPFEVDWYAERGCKASYVGHPYFDQLAGEQHDESFVQKKRQAPGPLVALLPGSRTQEVKDNLHRQLQAAELVRRKVPEARFAIAAFKPSHATAAQALVAKLDLPAEIHVGKTGELIRAADCAIAVSGSVSLELLYHTKPTVILYQVSRLGFFLQQFIRKVRYITLVNLLTDPLRFANEVGVYEPGNPRDQHVLMPEYLTCEDRSQEIAAHVADWLKSPTARQQRVAELAALKEKVGAGGASARAADYILKEIGSISARRLRTNYLHVGDVESTCRGAA